MRKLRGWKTFFAVYVICAATTIASPAEAQTTFTTLHSFRSIDGYDPMAALIQATDGNLYGTTQLGGSNPGCESYRSCGTVYKMSPSGTLTTLYSFCAQSGCTDGAAPLAGVIQATDGNFYGTTSVGGTVRACNEYPCGTVFKITSEGVLTTVVNFDFTDGTNPTAGLIEAANGDFYGTTYGIYSSPGNVFKLAATGQATTLHAFCSLESCSDGENPDAALVQGTDGNFYGTTQFGGNAFNDGVVFKITPGGTLSVLHTFEGVDGKNPYAGLVQGPDGDFYGAAAYGGTGGDCGKTGCGTLFKISPGGTFTTLHSFAGPEGAYPAGLVLGTDGIFYGTAAGGGPSDQGTIFSMTRGGTLKMLYSFCAQSGCPDGTSPEAALVQDTNGDFYGTASTGGVDSAFCNLGPGAGCGTVFRLSVGLVPFVTTQTTAGTVGSTVKILGTDLEGSTSVTFNGTSAAFTVESATYIETTVPPGATNGPVQVVTPSGTLTSNVNFRVLP